MVDWFNAIRAARFHYLQVAFPGANDEEVRRTCWELVVRETRDDSVEPVMVIAPQNDEHVFISDHFFFFFFCSWCLN